MKKALVVDDERDARDFVRAILEGEGWNVEEAANGDLGLKAAKSIKPDLVVLDVQMPQRDGFDVFSELSRDADLKDTRVIMLTGVAAKVGIRFSKEEMGEFLGREPDAYVEKPIDPEAFKRVVRKVTGT